MRFSQQAPFLLPFPGTSIGPRGSGRNGAVFGVAPPHNECALLRRRSLNPAPLRSEYGNPISETEHEPAGSVSSLLDREVLMKNIQQIMKQAQQMQEQLQKQMAELSVEGTAGGGMVLVRMNGLKQVSEVKSSPMPRAPEMWRCCRI